MPAAYRRPGTSVIQRLLDEPQRFEFFQAVRMLVQWLGEHGVPPDMALAGYLRFRNSTSLGFPPSEIEALRAVSGDAVCDHQAMANALRARQPLQIQVTPSFMGFLGAHGALPLHVTERVSAWQGQQHDDAPRAFLDMLSNRMLALFYEAWRKYRVEQGIIGGRDGFLPLLLGLAGFEPGSEAINADGVREEAVALYAGLLLQRPVSAVALERMLAGYLGVPVRVEEAVGHWNPMADHEQACLGTNAVLGENTLLGARGWRPDLRARIRIGPLERGQFDRFLPQSRGAAALRRVLGLFADQTLAYEIALVLRADQVRPARLACASACDTRLGLDSFLLTGTPHADRADVRYDITPMAPLPARRMRASIGGIKVAGANDLEQCSVIGKDHTGAGSGSAGRAASRSF